MMLTDPLSPAGLKANTMKSNWLQSISRSVYSSDVSLVVKFSVRDDEERLTTDTLYITGNQEGVVGVPQVIRREFSVWGMTSRSEGVLGGPVQGREEEEGGSGRGRGERRNEVEGGEEEGRGGGRREGAKGGGMLSR